MLSEVVIYNRISTDHFSHSLVWHFNLLNCNCFFLVMWGHSIWTFFFLSIETPHIWQWVLYTYLPCFLTIFRSWSSSWELAGATWWLCFINWEASSERCRLAGGPLYYLYMCCGCQEVPGTHVCVKMWSSTICPQWVLSSLWWWDWFKSW